MLSLLVSAELTGVTDLRPKDTEEEPYFYTFKVQCTSCREVHPNWVSFNRFEQHEIPGSRGEANFVWKCKLCQVGLFLPFMSSTRLACTSHLVFPCGRFYETQGDNEIRNKTHSASIVNGPHAYAGDEKRKGTKVIEIDCRGLEFTEFKPDGDWEVKGTESSTPFTGIDLSEGEWYDYDEKAGEEVSIKEISWELTPGPFCKLGTASQLTQSPSDCAFIAIPVGTELIIRLKWGQTEYKGKLESIDSYMNVLLRDTEEFIDGKNTGTLGLVLIRCNNILWMGSADSVEMTDLGLR
ncbi:hypothetical protein CNMCM8927_005890 [Aspergillus lentulus]|uniref:Sm protein F n=1 Tax=Aspergillus lentulus TaxID=293939 RepID=A0AAN5YYD2_ASPLE|nr:hypothetical protein CNMCM8927_005890 [Aspergillus lentulus]